MKEPKADVNLIQFLQSLAAGCKKRLSNALRSIKARRRGAVSYRLSNVPIEGSVRVFLNGEPLEKGRHYKINKHGRLVFLLRTRFEGDNTRT